MYCASTVSAGKTAEVSQHKTVIEMANTNVDKPNNIVLEHYQPSALPQFTAIKYF